MKKLRSGFTTGSCAAAAAKAAAWMLLTGTQKDNIKIITPKGSAFDARILKIERSGGHVRCAVRKDGGDDPDVTTGALIYADVSLAEVQPGDEDKSADERIVIEGGEGVGRVTRPGLDQPVGEAAINSVPRSMITKEVSEVAEACDYSGGISVTISVPGGEEIAKHTFNPRLGIEGGISIIGTSGVVEPMSGQAVLDTIRVELRQKRAEGCDIAFVSPGSYGIEFMKETYGVDLDRSVKCSNFIGDTADMIKEMGFRGFLLTGHAGKLVKIAGGAMNTHSKYGDRRMELIAAAAQRAGAGSILTDDILHCLTAEEAFDKLGPSALAGRTAALLMDDIMRHLNERTGGCIDAWCIMYTKKHGQLAASEGAEAVIEQNRSIWNNA